MAWLNEGISLAVFCRNLQSPGGATEKRSPTRNSRAVPEPGCADLTGLHILVVEDSADLGVAVASLLQACAADVAGPVATTTDAYRLIEGRLPDVALIDLHLRAGERADELIARLHDQGVRVVVTSGDTSRLGTRMKADVTLSKPFSEDELIAAVMPAHAALVASRTAQASVPPLRTVEIR